MIAMKRILFVLPVLPYPLISGGNQAMFNGISAIKDDFDVSVIYLESKKSSSKNKETLQHILKDAKIIPYKYNPLKTYSRFWCFLRNRIAAILNVPKKDCDYKFGLMPEKFYPIYQEYIDFINDYVKNNQIDIVQFEMLSQLSQAVSLPSSVKKIFVHHELGFVVNNLRLRSTGFSEYRKSMVELAKILEIGLLNKCDSVITLSEIDKEKLIEAGVKVPVYSSFAVVNTKKISIDYSGNPTTLSFVGPSMHSPNRLGVKWFLDNCWDDLLKNDSSYKLRIIGNWEIGLQKKILAKYRNIEFAGFVNDLAEALANTIMIVPITVGSGIRMKILEAACLGIPFVSTTVGAEGLPFENGKDCLKGDTPEEFVEAVLKMSDKSLRFEFAKNANALVKEKYSMDALRRNRLEIYKKVMES